MEKFDFQLVLIAVILGLAIAEVLTCVTHMVLGRHRTRAYWVHLVWLATLFMLAAQYWYSLYSWRSLGSLGDSFFTYLLNLLFPVALYVSSAVIGPRVPPGHEVFEFRAYYYDNHRGIFATFAVTLATLTVQQSAFLGMSWTHPANLLRGVAVLLLVVLARFANVVLHSVCALLLLGALVAFVALFANA